MPVDVEIDCRTEDAVLWPPGKLDRYGEPAFSNPQPLCVRWNWGRGESTDAQGNVIALDATVVVDRRAAVGSRMWLGNKLDLPADGDFSGKEHELLYVRTVSEVKDIKGRATRYELGLSRNKDTLS